MSLNWNKLRAWNGSQQTAFEKLCCQLYAEEKSLIQGEFIVKGSGGDAGVECYRQLPNSDEYALQAKFFLSPPTSNQWSQIDDSVQVALDKHSNVIRYTICLPIDRSDARDSGKQSFKDKWDEHVLKWQRLASDKGMTVEFVYWGETEIFTRLMIGARGKLYFWFNDETFDNDWFSEKFRQAKAIAGPRYTPELNIDLPIAKIFDGMGRTNRFFAEYQAIHKRLRTTFHNYSIQQTASHAPELFPKYQMAINALFTILNDIPSTSLLEPILFSNLELAIKDVSRCNDELNQIIFEKVQRAKQAKEEKQFNGRTSNFEIEENALYYFREMRHSLELFRELIQSPMSRLANTPYLVLTGEAGSGKTHLLCDIAEKRIEASLPTILVMGELLSANDEPWQQVIRELHLSTSVDEFLGALNTLGQLRNTRTLIFIDAVNESEAAQQWPIRIRSMLEKLKGFNYIGLSFSIRIPYDEFILPSELFTQGKLIKATHEGFAGFEYKAIQTYFDHYGIEQPSFPLLNPEFSNPLFLKLICQGLANDRVTRLPTGFVGITKLLGIFVSSVNRKIAERLDYDPSSLKVQAAIEDLVKEMVSRGDSRLPREEAMQIVNRHLNSNGYKQSLYFHMLSEGVITQFGYSEKESFHEYTRFSFERFADYLIGNYVLDHISDIEAAFVVGTELHNLLTGNADFSIQNALIGALSIQLPEKIGKELLEVAPYLVGHWRVGEAFIDSLLWRKWELSTEIPESTLKLINKMVRRNHTTDDRMLTAFISLAVNPDNPLNADFLHRNLVRHPLVERDEWWTVFLHNQYNWSEAAQDPIQRLLDWVTSRQDTSHIDVEVLRLSGIILSWFLASSNRFLRDRVTKAMVCLFTNRITALVQNIEQFIKAADLYIVERLFAVAYGCALRSQDKSAITDLANNTYQWVFAKNEPTPHVMIRCYARSIIELALQRDLPIKVDIKRVQPPYNSSWIDDPLTEDELKEKFGRYWDQMDDMELGRLHIYSSIMSLGDFGNYVIESRVHHWTRQKLSEPYQPSAREQYDTFITSFTERQKRAWERFHTTFIGQRKVSVQIVWDGSDDDLDNPSLYSEGENASDVSECEPLEADDNKAHSILEEALERFIKTLGQRKLRIFEEVIIPYLTGSSRDDNNNYFDANIARRWILQRVFEMGWTAEKFGEFDHRINYFRGGREGKKAERIGKKYQWIALNEFMARLADNFVYRFEPWEKDKARTYQGTWQIGMRDLDPSSLTDKTHRQMWDESPLTWWFTADYKEWDTDLENERWLADSAKLPDIADLISIFRSRDASSWLTLDGYYKWQEPVPAVEEKYERPRRTIWYSVNSYILKKDDIGKFIEWANQQDFMGRWMPENHPLHDVFMGELYQSIAFDYSRLDSTEYQDWSPDYYGRLPVSVCLTTDQYSNDEEYDCSIEAPIYIEIPSRWLTHQLGLHWNGRDGEFVDKQGNLMAFDPTVKEPGPQVLLINKECLLSFLSENGYEIVWTLLGEKQLVGGSHLEERSSGNLRINGAYRLLEGKLTGETRCVYFSPPQTQKAKP